MCECLRPHYSLRDVKLLISSGAPAQDARGLATQRGELTARLSCRDTRELATWPTGTHAPGHQR